MRLSGGNRAKTIKFHFANLIHMYLRLFTISFILLFAFQVNAQTVCTLESRAKLDQVLTDLEQQDLSNKTPNELIVHIGQLFLATPYVEKTLELPGAEKLVINFQGLDCTTFVETVLSLARLTEKGEFTFEAYEKELENIRYRNGVNTGYPSRLHYFSDWIYENEKKELITDITKRIGGVPYVNAPSFMSENPKFYPQLSEQKNVDAIRNIEKQITARSYFYIPKTAINTLEAGIKSGDVIAITTSMSNLDMVHTGFAFEKNGRIHLMHASSKNMLVEISEVPLSDYLKGNKSQSGIMVARLKSTQKQMIPEKLGVQFSIK